MNSRIRVNGIYKVDCILGTHAMEPSSVDMVVTDLPYVNSSHAWDVPIPFDQMWVALKRVIKPNAAMIFTGVQPFTSKLIMSNLKMFRHTLVWDKVLPQGFLNAAKMPLRRHEDIVVFADRLVTYNPKMEERGLPRNKGSSRKPVPNQFYGVKTASDTFNNLYYPTSIVQVSNSVNKGKIHPTQKPVELFQYLIETYSNPGDTVLDLCMGSGTTAVACINSGRDFIGFENSDTFWPLCIDRVMAHLDYIENSYVPLDSP